MRGIKASVCIATYRKANYLDRVLQSIFCQSPPFSYEVIVVDDGSPEIDTESVCLRYDDKVRYYRINREPSYRNPSVARNYAYERANGNVLIPQSDDVVHCGPAISMLVDELEKGKFVIGSVFNVDFDTGLPVYYRSRWYQFTGPRANPKYSPNPERPLFFLGSVYKDDVFAIGGCDEDFVEPGKDDIWFADCLMNDRGLVPYYSFGIVGYHLHHDRPEDLSKRSIKSSLLYHRKVSEAKKTGIWKSRKGLKTAASFSAS